MKFRPCIDIHNGRVKQIIGGSLSDQKDQADENFVSEKDAAFFAKLYRSMGLTGGHVILLNALDSPFYKETKRQALEALRAYPQGFQAGGGITPDCAEEFLKAGASAVIVTSYLFEKGEFSDRRLKEMVSAVGKDRLVLDLSCRKKGDKYYIVTDRWQHFTAVALNRDILHRLAESCREFLIHGVDVEGKAQGIERELAALLGEWCPIPVTYAGGVHSFEDLKVLKELGRDKIDVTIGSALSLFGGDMELEEVLRFLQKC